LSDNIQRLARTDEIFLLDSSVFAKDRYAEDRQETYSAMEPVARGSSHLLTTVWNFDLEAKRLIGVQLHGFVFRQSLTGSLSFEPLRENITDGQSRGAKPPLSWRHPDFANHSSVILKRRPYSVVEGLHGIGSIENGIPENAR
jgi:hypothetical protein